MKRVFLRRNRLAVAVGTAILGGATTPAAAFELQMDNPNISGRLDTTVSAGAMFRTESRDPELAATGDVVDMTAQGFGSQINKNDANNNFDTGLASMVYKITPEMDLSWKGRYGVFLRGTAFTDRVIEQGNHDGGVLDPSAPFVPPNGFTRYATFSHHANNGTGDDFPSDAERYAGKRARMLDAYVWTDFDLFDRPLNIRAGQQVINWGEALFFQGGINTANYFDLNALRLPGAEIKEALLPLDSVSFSYGLSFNSTLEGFYQVEWENSEDAPAGTYFSTHDAFPGRGADNVIVDGRVVAAGAGAPGLENAFAGYTLATYGASGSDYEYEQTQVTVNRIRDEEAKDGDQFGVAYRYFAEGLNGTEFGLYYTRTHSRLPVVGARINNLNQGGGPAALPQTIDTTEYQMAYTEDQDMYGFSFNTNVGPVSVAGEVAYRPERTILNEVGDNLIQSLARVAGQSTLLAQDITVGDLTPHCVRIKLGGSCLASDTLVDEGQLYYFYDEVESFNASLVNTFNFGPRLGTDNLVALLEVGMEHIGGASNDRLDYSSTAALLSSEVPFHEREDTYFLTDTSWGYRAVLKADYNNIFAGISMSPSIRIAHDVNGNSPTGGNFMEDRKAATLAFDFVYLEKVEMGVSATSFWGADYANKLGDRNNASVSLKYSF